MTSASNKSHQEKVWMKHYKDLVTFQQSTGREYPSASDPHTQLYHWCKNQRRFHNKGIMPEDREKLLDKINFRWNTLNYTFEKRLDQLIKFKKKHGSLHVSQVKYAKNTEYHKLSRWVNEIRRMYNENRLSINRIIELDKIDFIWNMEDERFASNLSKLKRFYKVNGHFDVPQTGRNKKLGEWVAQVRCRGLSKKHYVEALNQIGFEWLGKKKRLQKAKTTLRDIDLKNRIRKGRINAKRDLKKGKKILNS